MLFSWPLEKFKTIYKSIPFFVFFVSFVISEVFAVGAALYLNSQNLDRLMQEVNSESTWVAQTVDKWILSGGLNNAPLDVKDSNYVNNTNIKSIEKSNFEIIIWSRQGNILWHSDQQIQSMLHLRKEDKDRKYKDLFILENQFDIVRTLFQQRPEINSIQENNDPGEKIEIYRKYIYMDEPYYYILRRASVEDSSSGWILWSLLFSFCISIFMGIATRGVAGGILKPLEAMRSSLGYLNKMQQAEPVHYYSDNEIGKLVEEYNKLIKQTASANSGNVFSDAPNQDFEAELTTLVQQQLFNHPFPRLQGIEAALYPRKPGIPMQNFYSAAQHNDVLYVFLGHFDITSANSAIQKLRLQEQFFSFVKAGMEADETARNLWDNMFTHLDFGPGILFLSFDLNSKEWKIFRSGPFEVFVLDKEDYRKIENGNGYFSSDYTGLENMNFTNGESLTIITNEVLDHLNFDAEEFQWKILNRLSYNDKAGEQLVGMLDSIAKVEQIGENFSGLLSCINQK
ncbi:MAG: hypothetical protein ABUK01_06795 [Leptospirales bacterium]